MSLYGKLGGILLSTVIVGSAATYVADIGSNVIDRAEALSVSASCYEVRAHEGGIAVFGEGSEQPISVYPMPVEGISEADIALLEKGIRIRGLEDVFRLLEDLDIES